MQPRLVAISYPSSPTEGYDGQQNTFRSHLDAYLTLQSRLTKKIRKFTWVDLRSQISGRKSKRTISNAEGSFADLQPYSDISSDAQSIREITHPGGIPTSKWQTLPPSIQANILGQLKVLHQKNASNNAHRFRNDLIAVQSTCRAWYLEAQRKLYESITLKPNYDYDRRTTHYNFWETRVSKLRQTLRSNPTLAGFVKHLTLIPESQQYRKDEAGCTDLLASVVMACPNLETWTSFYVLYTHRYDRLVHALSTRTQMTQHTWVIGEDELTRSRAGHTYSSGILDTHQTQLFVQLHANWSNLETLNIISHKGNGILEHGLFVKVLNMLPKLKRLHVSSFDANDFSDETLLALPDLVSLRLEGCKGVTESGLCQWAQSPRAASIQRLVLESQNITSLLTIAELLASLEQLEVFRIVQLEFEPVLPLELDVENPLFASSSLKTLEWCVADGVPHDLQRFQDGAPRESMYKQLHKHSLSKSSQHLLSSILEIGFPQLEKLLLAGYGDLNGLLRWVRNSAPATRKNTATPFSGFRSGVPSTASLLLHDRNSSRLSLRPSSPTFMEYDHWRRTPLTQVVETTIAKTTNQTMPEDDLPNQCSPSSSTHSATLSSSNSSTSRRDSNDTGSMTSRTSSPSPRNRSFAKSSSTTLHSAGHTDEIGADFLASHHSLSAKHQPTPSSDSKWESHIIQPEPIAASKHSSISILLDGYI